MEKIVLLDEEGIEREFEVLASFGLDDCDYVALNPTGDREDIYILRLEYEDNDELILVGIEDDEELNDAILAYESLLEDE